MVTKKVKAPKAAAKKPAVKAKRAASRAATPQAVAPVKTAFTKASLTAHLATAADVEAKVVKKVLAALEATAIGALNKKGLGEFALPGLLKITALKVPAKKRRFGKNPFTGEEQWFAAKPASVRVKVRPLKKLKDAAQ